MQTAEALIEDHTKMVHHLARRLRRELSLRGEIDDLVAFGYGGLLEARERFDESRGVQFQTFAYYRVRGAMLDGVRKMAQLPRRAHERVREQESVSPTAMPQPGPTQLERVFARVSAGLTAAGPCHGALVGDSPEDFILRQESVERLLQALSGLSHRERSIVRGYYFEGRTLDAIAKELGISKSWASRIHTGALRTLRHALEP